MKTILLTVPESSENWFKTLFNKFHLKHKILTDHEREDLLLAKLIDEAMSEEGEVPKEKVNKFIKKYGTKI